MARLKSLLKIEGTLDGMTFYKKADGQYYVRTKGGVKKDRIANDPAFARTRENNLEFKEVAQSNKQLRRAMVASLTNVKDRTKTSRLTSLLFKVKNFDATSGRGERKVSLGIQQTGGKELLKGFDFNKNAPLDTVLLQNYVVNTTSKEISLSEFTPNIMLANPKGATHVRLTAYHANYNFTSFESELAVSNIETLAIDTTSSDLTFSFATPATGSGTEFFLLKVEFLQELNGQLYQLNNGTFNALKLVAII